MTHLQPTDGRMVTSCGLGLDGPKGELVHLLERVSDTIGLTDSVIRMLVDQSEISYPGVRLSLVSSTRRSLHVRFIVKGVARVVCEVPHFGRATVDFVGKGEFLCLPPAQGPNDMHRLDAIVHEGPLVLALIPRNAFVTALGQLPPSNASRLVSWSWRAPSRLAHAKTALLTLPTTERLLHELIRLARRFGRPAEQGWTLIQLRLPQDDLAALILRSRSNVSRAYARLRSQGLVDRVAHRLMIATPVLLREDPLRGVGLERGPFAEER